MIWSIWTTLLVVDQVYEDVVVVEWENESLSVVERIWFPQAIQEGDILELKFERIPLSNCRLWPVQDRGSSKWLDCDGLEQVYLPVAPVWRGRATVYWNIHYPTDSTIKNHNADRVAIQ